MSSPSAPEASCLRLASSSAWRFSPLAATSPAYFLATTTTPSSSATTASPGSTLTPAQTTGMLTAPSVDGSLGRNRLRPHRKAHLAQRLHIAAAGIDDKAGDAARLQRGREQIAEHAVRTVGAAADHQDVARPALFHRDMNHPVVPRIHHHGDAAPPPF